MSQLPLIAAIVSGLCFTLLGILIKRNTSAGASPFILPSWLALLFPVWAGAFIVSHATGQLHFNLTPSALLWPLLWAACTVTTTTLLVWLLQSLSLTEVAGYKKALLTLLASGADIFLFQTVFPYATVAALACILVGSLILGHVRNSVPNLRQGLALVGWCVIITAQVSAYKYGQNFQPDVLAFTVLAQGSSSFLYTLLWLLPSVKNTPFKLTQALPLLAVAFTGVAIEGFAYKALPLAVVILITMSGAALFAVYDLATRDLPLTKRTALALAAIALGFMLLFVK